jgi:hypothetical protein
MALTPRMKPPSRMRISADPVPSSPVPRLQKADVLSFTLIRNRHDISNFQPGSRQESRLGGHFAELVSADRALLATLAGKIREDASLAPLQ